jgi:hypothetical protein
MEYIYGLKLVRRIFVKILFEFDSPVEKTEINCRRDPLCLPRNSLYPPEQVSLEGLCKLKSSIT